MLSLMKWKRGVASGMLLGTIKYLAEEEKTRLTIDLISNSAGAVGQSPVSMPGPADTDCTLAHDLQAEKDLLQGPRRQ